MEQQPHQQSGGEQQPDVNSYGTDDPEQQAHIEAARAAASSERRRDREHLERMTEAGIDPGDAEAVIEFGHMVREQRAEATPTADATTESDPTPADPEANATEESRERPQRYQPRIYAACLASYNNGILHGLWIDADQDLTELQTDITAMLASSPIPDAEEWAVHDHDDFAGYQPGEYEPLAVVSQIAKGIAEHGAAYAAWAGSIDTATPELLGKFSDFYIGSYDSPEAWALTVAEDLAWERRLDDTVDPMLRPYLRIDYAAFAHDASLSWDLIDGSDGQTHVFLR